MPHKISHSNMVYALVLEAYIHVTLICTEYHIFPLLPIKDLINEDVDPTKPFKFATGKKPSILHLRILFCPCVVHKSPAHVGIIL